MLHKSYISRHQLKDDGFNAVTQEAMDQSLTVLRQIIYCISININCESFSPMSLSDEKILTTKYVTLSRTLLIHVLFFIYIIEAAEQQEVKHDRVLATV